MGPDPENSFEAASPFPPLLLRALVEGSREGIVACDATGLLTVFNAAAMQQHGGPCSAGTPETWARACGWLSMDETPLPLQSSPLYRALQGEAVDNASWRVRRPDGTLRTLSGRAFPLRTATGASAGAVLLCHDETDQVSLEIELQERVELLALEMEVGTALVETGDLRRTLDRCADALVRHLRVAIARLWTLNVNERVLELQASAGMYTHLDGAHGHVPMGMFKIGQIAEERVPHLTNQVIGDPRVSDQAWATREGMVSFAGYPLLIGDRVVGVMAVFARRPLSEATLHAMKSVANGIAGGIERHRQEEVTQSRADFERQLIGIVSHDLRGPLSVINMAASFLDNGKETLGGNALRSVQRIQSATGRANRMIRDLLDFSQTRLGGGIPINLGALDLREVVRQAVDEVSAANPHRQITLEADQALPGEWDADRLAQVIHNLLGNAVSYSPPEAPVAVVLRGLPETVLLEVHNGGPPIAPELLPLLFEPLQRGGVSLDRKIRSIGLGLFIVREIVKAHRGTVEVQSGERVGTTFYVRLPRQRPDAQARP